MFTNSLFAQYQALTRAKRAHPLLLSVNPRVDREGNPRLTDEVQDQTATFVVPGQDDELITVKVHLRGEAAKADLIPMERYLLGEVSGWLYPSGNNVRVSWSAKDVRPVLQSGAHDE